MCAYYALNATGDDEEWNLFLDLVHSEAKIWGKLIVNQTDDEDDKLPKEIIPSPLNELPSDEIVQKFRRLCYEFVHINNELQTTTYERDLKDEELLDVVLALRDKEHELRKYREDSRVLTQKNRELESNMSTMKENWSVCVNDLSSMTQSDGVDLTNDDGEVFQDCIEDNNSSSLSTIVNHEEKTTTTPIVLIKLNQDTLTDLCDLVTLEESNELMNMDEKIRALINLVKQQQNGNNTKLHSSSSSSTTSQ